jgi:hypothetical protein
LASFGATTVKECPICMQRTIQFTWDDLTGEVLVDHVVNDDPEAYGCLHPGALGYPVCTATVAYPRRGYRAMFGWVQLVRSTDNSVAGEDFEVDPFALFDDTRSPYCWYGTEPTLFDAPSRSGPPPAEWLAHSFLATTPIEEVLRGGPRRVVPLLGFSWGFGLNDDEIQLRDVLPLTNREWIDRLPVLRASYPAPDWTFADDKPFGAA